MAIFSWKRDSHAQRDTNGRLVADVNAASDLLRKRLSVVKAEIGATDTEYGGLQWSAIGGLLYGLVDAVEALAGQIQKDKEIPMAKRGSNKGGKKMGGKGC